MSGSLTHVLFEGASGYALFTVSMQEEIGARTKAMQDAVNDYNVFSRMITLASFLPFTSAAQALENANDVSEGVLNDHLKNLLNLVVPSSGKGNKSSSKVLLGVSERGLAGAIQSELGIICDASDRSLELIRGIRLHQEKMLVKGGMQKGDVTVAQLGLGHSYSRGKVKFNVNRSDNMIIQAISLSDQLDKDLNTFSMRVREWYGWHFPELYKLVPDAHQYAMLAVQIGDKSTLSEDSLETLQEILDDDETRAKNVLDAARASMGSDISEIDLLNISTFAERVVKLAEYRKSLRRYLVEKMNVVAPNLSALIGETIAARLISHAGSLTNLAKYPASTVQILGAEKALFRALKTKGNTPKYGLIYHSTFIGRAGAKHKGRISRFLANKCSIACRIDCFTDVPTNKFGEALRAQVEERLAFFETGAPVSKNSDAIQKALTALANDLGDDEDDDDDEDGEVDEVEISEAVKQVEKDQESARKNKSAMDPELAKIAAGHTPLPTPSKDKSSKKEKKKEKKDKKDKKDKKRKSEDADDDGIEVEDEAERKRRKKEKKEKRKAEKAATEAAGGVEGDSKKEKKKKRKSEA
ncbi:putative small nuclear ribonucleo protein [Kockovaella imperatae]|uniref:Nucleolar protein 56 n=1 Tax=Kockovaella imperatae TaxID=4999 RepID=A0A1Y1UKM4_9TREE|nr:putative small nuclear ribonucleo protein [Kockovaella imperatae]ORX38522.1 putative small nuclear ribonucleo protein [Kockovaella imperatae]